jgi:murein DD-endopeptidase MepM/ murein hydrolase activator NlpD
MEFIKNYDVFAESELDIHVNNTTVDNKLLQKLQDSVDASIASGQGSLEDLMLVSTSNSAQHIARKLRDSAKKIREENQALEQQKLATMKELKEMEAIENQVVRDHEIRKLEMEIQRDKYKVDRDNETKLIIQEAITEGNAMIDLSNDRELDVADIALKERALTENERKNRAQEDLKRESNSIARKKSTMSKTK